MAFRWFQSMFRRETKRFNIYREYCKSVNSEQRLKENPYYEKYADKISELQKISPEDFKEMLNQKVKPAFEKPSSVKKETESFSDNQKNIPRFKGQKVVCCHNGETRKSILAFGSHGIRKDLNQIMKLETLVDKSAEDIESIWKQYHQSKDGLYAVLPKESYEAMCSKLQTYPIFLFPLPRAQGYEFIMHQFMEHSCYFTSLINFQAYKENAPVSLTITYFTELLENKGIVLMRGEYDDKALSIQEAQCLANQLQLYYGGEDVKKEKLLWTFNKQPELFRHMDLISNFEYELIK